MRELWAQSATEIAALVRAGRVSAEEVTMVHLDRIARLNPELNAIVQEFPEEAMAEARAVDAKIARGEDAGPLAGVPVTIKVNVDQTGHATTNGLRLQKDQIASQDNPVVANLRKAGAVIVGRTNTPAFSMRWFTNNSLGRGCRGGGVLCDCAWHRYRGLGALPGLRLWRSGPAADAGAYSGLEQLGSGPADRGADHGRLGPAGAQHRGCEAGTGGDVGR